MKEKEELRRLVNLPADERALDGAFIERVKKEQRNLLLWWKNKYNYSSNDERYLTATPSQIYKDRLEDIIVNLDKDFLTECELLRYQKKVSEEIRKRREEKQKDINGIWYTEEKR